MGSPPPGLGADSTRTVRATHGLSRSANFRTRRSRTPGATAEGSLAGNDSFSACDHRPRVATLATGETNCTTSTATWLRNDSMPPEHSLLTYAGTPVLLKISRMSCTLPLGATAISTHRTVDIGPSDIGIFSNTVAPTHT